MEMIPTGNDPLSARVIALSDDDMKEIESIFKKDQTMIDISKKERE